ncbi:co-chaperone GroES [Candidatus Dojkabacteria bacterium]|nr:co-chaperone GroES [Candidatus Dojkabacteria bacterium]
MAKTSKVRPIGGNILVEPVSDERTTQTGIVLPDTVNKEKPQKGKVVALGTGKMDQNGKVLPFNVKVGDIVMFKKYSPDELEIDDKEYLIMDEEAILAVID